MHVQKPVKLAHRFDKTLQCDGLNAITYRGIRRLWMSYTGGNKKNSRAQSTFQRTKPVTHTPSIAFRHLPPNSARFSNATEGALFISAQLSTDAVSALRKVPVLI